MSTCPTTPLQSKEFDALKSKPVKTPADIKLMLSSVTTTGKQSFLDADLKNAVRACAAGEAPPTETELSRALGLRRTTIEEGSSATVCSAVMHEAKCRGR